MHGYFRIREKLGLQGMGSLRAWNIRKPHPQLSCMQMFFKGQGCSESVIREMLSNIVLTAPPICLQALGGGLGTGCASSPIW